MDSPFERVSNKLKIVHCWEKPEVWPWDEKHAQEKWHALIVGWLKQQHDNFQFEDQENPEKCAILVIYVTSIMCENDQYIPVDSNTNPAIP